MRLRVGYFFGRMTMKQAVLIAILPFLVIAYANAQTSDFQNRLRLARAGDAAAQSYVGVMYAFGLDIKKDDKEAVKWYRLSAEQGFAVAQLNLGNMYASGRGVLQSFQEAMKFYQFAADQGLANAQKKLEFFTAKTFYIDRLVVTHIQDQSIVCSKGGAYSIDISGDIGPDSSFALDELIGRSQNCVDDNGNILKRTNISFSSNGGLIEHGYKMGKAFRDNGFRTQINANDICASSCAIAYLGGVERFMDETAFVMFHSPYIPSRDARGGLVADCNVGTESSINLLNYYQEMTNADQGQRLLDRTLSYCSATDGWVLRGPDAAELFGVATAVEAAPQ